MRQKRAKAYRKLMAMYELSFGFRQPYQVLIDSGMCLAAQDHKIELLKQLETVVQGKIKPMITQCCIVELYKMGKERQPAVDLAKEFERRKCNHREAIDGSECLESVVGEKNKHRYVIASQSQELRAKLRKIPAVPLVHITKSVMILEPPSEETLKAKAEMVEDALQVPVEERDTLPSTEPVETPAPKLHKKAKGPNPLSVKKKQPKLQTSQPPTRISKQDPTGAHSNDRKREREEDPNDDEPARPKKKRRRRKAHVGTEETAAKEQDEVTSE